MKKIIALSILLSAYISPVWAMISYAAATGDKLDPAKVGLMCRPQNAKCNYRINESTGFFSLHHGHGVENEDLNGQYPGADVSWKVSRHLMYFCEPLLRSHTQDDVISALKKGFSTTDENLEEGDVHMPMRWVVDDTILHPKDESHKAVNLAADTKELDRELIMMIPFGELDIVKAKTQGCSSIVAYIKNNTLYVANLGGTCALLSCKGKAEWISERHTPRNKAERERVEKAGGFIDEAALWRNKEHLVRSERDDASVDEYGSPITRGFGYRAYPGIIAEPDIKTVPFTADHDFLILGCRNFAVTYKEKGQEVVDGVKAALREKPNDYRKAMEGLCRGDIAAIVIALGKYYQK